jgi:hypothetical protein
MSSTAKRKISSKTLKDKYEALKKIERGIPKKDVAAQYKVPRNTLSTWVKNKEKIVKAFEGGNNPSTQKLKSSGHENLDQATYKWFVKMREEGLPISELLYVRMLCHFLTFFVFVFGYILCLLFFLNLFAVFAFSTWLGSFCSPRLF